MLFQVSALTYLYWVLTRTSSSRNGVYDRRGDTDDLIIAFRIQRIQIRLQGTIQPEGVQTCYYHKNSLAQTVKNIPTAGSPRRSTYTSVM